MAATGCSTDVPRMFHARRSPLAMIQRIQALDYRCLRFVDIPLGERQVLVGPNGGPRTGTATSCFATATASTPRPGSSPAARCVSSPSPAGLPSPRWAHLPGRGPRARPAPERPRRPPRHAIRASRLPTARHHPIPRAAGALSPGRSVLPRAARRRHGQGRARRCIGGPLAAFRAARGIGLRSSNAARSVSAGPPPPDRS